MRHPVVQKIVKAYEDYENRNKKKPAEQKKKVGETIDEGTVCGKEDREYRIDFSCCNWVFCHCRQDERDVFRPASWNCSIDGSVHGFICVSFDL